MPEFRAGSLWSPVNWGGGRGAERGAYGLIVRGTCCETIAPTPDRYGIPRKRDGMERKLLVSVSMLMCMVWMSLASRGDDTAPARVGDARIQTSADREVLYRHRSSYLENSCFTIKSTRDRVEQRVAENNAERCDSVVGQADQTVHPLIAFP